MGRIIVIDDDPALLRVMKIALQGLGHDVRTAMTGETGLSEIALHDPDAVVLDLGLPEMDGVEVARRIREWSDVPVIVLSADATEERKIEALDAGADDYVTKPFSMGELQARLRVALRRRRTPEGAAPAADAEVHVGPLRMDLAHHEAWLSDVPLELTNREFAVLAFLARNEGRVCTQRMILEAVWGPGYTHEANYLREYSYRLRRKLGTDVAVTLRTRPGIGYQLLVTEGADAPRTDGAS